MPQAQNIGRAFLDRAGIAPDSVVIMDEDAQVTLGQLAGMSLAFALHLKKHGVGQKSTIAIRSDDPVVVLASVLATAMVGCRWVYAKASLLKQSPVEVTHYFQTDIEDGKIHPDAVPIDETWAAPPEGHAPSRPPQFQGYRAASDPWLIFSSSGTTGIPKYMELSHRNVFDRVAAAKPEFAQGPSRVVFLFGVHAAPSLFRCLAAMLSGWALVYSADPAFWHQSGVTHVFGSPAQINHVLLGMRLPTKLEKVLVGGGMLSDDQTKELFENFEHVINNYGSTEASHVLANVKTLDRAGDVITRTVLRDCEVEVVDDNDRALPPDHEGTIRVRNGYLAPGYLDSPEAEAGTFRDGWFYPGDRGLWTTDGNLVVTGRVNEQFNLGGTKVNAVLMDYVLLTVEGVKDAICFLMPQEGGPDQLMAFLQTEDGQLDPDLIAAAKLRLTIEFGVDAIPKRFLFIDRIPRNEGGKPDRRACIELAEEGRRKRNAKSEKRD
ncbi:MAG TPA: long-chain fatty acid--CoA ligase [Devosia sp.]|nr:long-chain fatty acid--CoA ligase [Devosia sp.]